MTDAKFKIRDKVFIKSLDREGIVVAWSRNKKDNWIDVYEVAYLVPEGGWVIDDCLPVAEYLGPSKCRIKTSEEDLELKP